MLEGLDVALSVSALGSSIAGVVGVYYKGIMNQNKRHAESCERLRVLETKIDVFWKIVEQKLAKLLMQPTHLRKDALLQKLIDGQLEGEELLELRDTLNQELKERHILLKDESNMYIAYTLIIARLEGMIETRWPLMSAKEGKNKIDTKHKFTRFFGR